MRSSVTPNVRVVVICNAYVSPPMLPEQTEAWTARVHCDLDHVVQAYRGQLTGVRALADSDV